MKILNEEKNWYCFEMLNTWSQLPLKWHAESSNVTIPRNACVSLAYQIYNLSNWPNIIIILYCLNSPILRPFSAFWPHVNWSESKTINKLWAVGWAFAPPSLASAIFCSLSLTVLFVHGQNGEKQKKLCSCGNACYVGLISVPNPR